MIRKRESRSLRTALQSGIFALICLGCLPAQAGTIGSSMVGFLQGRVNTRVGGGDCEDMVVEALRVGGGEFTPGDLGDDAPGTGDTVWGAPVTVISCATTWNDTNPASPAQPGDIIQFNSAIFTYSPTSVVKTAGHHTAVVATVDADGRPTSIYQQNFDGVRAVRTADIDTTKLTDGWLRIYRPKGRADGTDQWKVTVANSTPAPQTFTIMVGTTVIGSVTLTAAGSPGSFVVKDLVTDGTVPALVLSNGTTLYLQTAKGNRIYDGRDGTVEVRQLRQ